MQIKAEYEKLAKKYKLPDYEAIDNEFELLYFAKIEEITFPLRFIRRRIADKLFTVCSMLQSILQPNPGSIVNLQEASFFDKDQKKAASDLLKELMQLERKSLCLDIMNDEKDDAVFIKDAYDKWLKLKTKVHETATRLKDGWSEERKIDRGQYFG